MAWSLMVMLTYDIMRLEQDEAGKKAAEVDAPGPMSANPTFIPDPVVPAPTPAQLLPLDVPLRPTLVASPPKDPPPALRRSQRIASAGGRGPPQGH